MKHHPKRRASDARATPLGRLLDRWRNWRHEPDYGTILFALILLLFILKMIYGER